MCPIVMQCQRPHQASQGEKASAEAVMMVLLTYTSSSEIQEDRTTQSTRSNDKNVCSPEFYLPYESEKRDQSRCSLLLHETREIAHQEGRYQAVSSACHTFYIHPDAMGGETVFLPAVLCRRALPAELLSPLTLYEAGLSGLRGSAAWACCQNVIWHTAVQQSGQAVRTCRLSCAVCLWQRSQFVAVITFSRAGKAPTCCFSCNKSTLHQA